jgi:hypothetical protein
MEAEASDIAEKGDVDPEGGVVNGMLEISPEDASACLTLTGLSFSEALLTDGETAVAFAPADAVAGDICVDAPTRELGMVNGDPGRFILEVHLSGGDVVTAPLAYLDQSAPESHCAGIHFSPTYLPWIERGDEIPTPEVGATPGAKGTMLLWASDEELFDSAHLSIFTTRDSILGEDSGVRLLDNEGYLDLYAGGAMAISWDLGTETCNRVVLELTPEDDTSDRDTEAQLRKIARSLQFGSEMLTEEGGTRQCQEPPARPRYLPWLPNADGDEIPPPRDSYDPELDRYQQSWADPRFPPGEGGVGLAIYPLPRGTDGGVRTGIILHDVEGRLHRGEGGSVSVSWDLDQPCNFFELTLNNPDADAETLERELLRVARSLKGSYPGTSL